MKEELYVNQKDPGLVQAIVDIVKEIESKTEEKSDGCHIYIWPADETRFQNGRKGITYILVPPSEYASIPVLNVTLFLEQNGTVSMKYASDTGDEEILNVERTQEDIEASLAAYRILISRYGLQRYDPALIRNQMYWYDKEIQQIFDSIIPHIGMPYTISCIQDTFDEIETESISYREDYS